MFPDLAVAKQDRMFEKIHRVIALTEHEVITEARKAQLQALIDYINVKREKGEPVRLKFICTHNSRRSQFSQIWAAVAAHHFGIRVESFSGGVEVTECNTRTISSLMRMGFVLDSGEGMNPRYSVRFSNTAEPAILFSKLYDDAINPVGGFAAIMTCSNADENCPLVTGCEQRISLRYNDPKAYDDSPMEEVMYDYRSYQIATELMYVFSQVRI